MSTTRSELRRGSPTSRRQEPVGGLLAPSAEHCDPRVTVPPMLHQSVEDLAYHYWNHRGRPVGSPDEEWFRAEEEVRARKLRLGEDGPES